MAEMLKVPEWRYRVEPGAHRFSWWVYVTHGAMRIGPDGGPYWVWGTQRMAVRKGERVIARQTEAERRRAALTVEGP